MGSSLIQIFKLVPFHQSRKSRAEQENEEMQAPDEIKKYCANCGKEITGRGIDVNPRYSVCSEDCKKEFTKGSIF